MSTLAESYAKIRKQYGASAPISIHWAREELAREAMGIEWSTDSNYLPSGTGIIDGFEIEVSIDYDTDPMWRGEFSDTYRSGAVQNPNYRPNAYDSQRRLQWFMPESGSLSAHIADYRRMGYGKHAAYTAATKQLRLEALSSAEPNQHIITATVSFNDVELSQETIHGYDVNESAYFDDLIVGATDLIQTAVSEAKEKLASLQLV